MRGMLSTSADDGSSLPHCSTCDFGRGGVTDGRRSAATSPPTQPALPRALLWAARYVCTRGVTVRRKSSDVSDSVQNASARPQPHANRADTTSLSTESVFAELYCTLKMSYGCADSCRHQTRPRHVQHSQC